jgi:hypothetical protein
MLTAALPALAGGAGQLVGTITDESGKTIPEARLTIAGPGASAVQNVITDGQGRFRMLVMETVRPVTVRVEAEGKVPVSYREVRVLPDRVTHLDLRLRSRGSHDVLVLVDGRVPYHYLALEGARSTLPGEIDVIDLRTGESPGRDFMRALEDHPSAVLAIGEEAARMARSLVRDTPVVHTMVPDPVAGEMSSPVLCGISLTGGFTQQMQRLRALDPGVRTIGTIFDPSRLTGAVTRLRRAAEDEGMALVTGHVHQPGDLPHALDDLAREKIDAFVVLMDPEVYTVSNFALIRQYAEDRDLIFVVPDASLARVGKSFSFRPGFRESGAAAGRLVRQIVAGRLSPGDIGILRPVEGEMGGDVLASPAARWLPDPGENLPLVGAVTLAAALRPDSEGQLEPAD